ncbi:hypothetical protein Tco_1104293 [Tanacetum coccineum]
MSMNHATIKTLVEFFERRQAANISTHTLEPSRCFNSICYDDDDDDYDEKSTIPLSKMPQILQYIAIAPILSTMKPEDSLIMRNEELNTIPEKESDEVIKSSVEDLVPIPKGKSVTFSNPLFDSNDDFTSSDDESLSDEDVLEDNDIEIEDSYVSNLDEPVCKSYLFPVLMRMSVSTLEAILMRSMLF